MHTDTCAGLTVSAIAELLAGQGFRITVALDDVIVAERPVLGLPQVLRRVVGQQNEDGSFRVGYLFARATEPGGPVYQNDLVARESGCRDVAQLVEWLAIQDARVFPAKVGS